MSENKFPRGHGDIQATVIALVDHLAPIVPIPRQPGLARKIAELIVSQPSSMGQSMHLRQSVIRGGVATPSHVVDGLAAWITVLFDLGNLRLDRSRAMEIAFTVSDAALEKVRRALAGSTNGCILALPHVGSLELFAAHLKDRGFELSFLYSMGEQPTPMERWIYEGRAAILGNPIAVGRKNTREEIARVLDANGLLIMIADVYPNPKRQGIPVKIDAAELRYPPGPARFAQTGTPVLPAFASGRDAKGISIDILDPLEYRPGASREDAGADFTQRLAAIMGGFTAQHPQSYWLWHPIPNDPYLAFAERQRPDLLSSISTVIPDDEATALAMEALRAKWMKELPE